MEADYKADHSYAMRRLEELKEKKEQKELKEEPLDMEETMEKMKVTVGSDDIRKVAVRETKAQMNRRQKMEYLEWKKQEEEENKEEKRE